MSTQKLDSIKDLLLEDYNHYGEWLHRNEESGEKRVNLYITLLAAIPTAIVAIGEKNDFHIYENGSTQIIFSMVLFALLLFGYFTFLRLIKRNAVTDEMKFAMDNIRQQYMDIYDTGGYLTYRILPKQGNPMFCGEKLKPVPGKHREQPDKNDLVWEMKFPEDIRKPKTGLSRKWVSLVYLVLLLNALVLTALIFILMNRYCPDIPGKKFYLLGFFILAGFVQNRVIKKRDAAARKQTDLLRYSHAGAVVYRKTDSASAGSAAGIEYLVISSLPKNDQEKTYSVLPKGHIEFQEEISATALREVYEETGVIARIERTIGSFEHSFTEANIKKRIHVKMYLMESLQQSKEKEKRNLQWLTFDAAYELLSFHVYKRMLFQANAFLLTKISTDK